MRLSHNLAIGTLLNRTGLSSYAVNLGGLAFVYSHRTLPLMWVDRNDGRVEIERDWPGRYRTDSLAEVLMREFQHAPL